MVKAEKPKDPAPKIWKLGLKPVSTSAKKPEEKKPQENVRISSREENKPLEYISEEHIWRDNSVAGIRGMGQARWLVYSPETHKKYGETDYAVYVSVEKAKQMYDFFNNMKKQNKVTKKSLIKLIESAENIGNERGGILIGFIEQEGKIGIIYSSPVLELRYPVEQEQYDTAAASKEPTPVIVKPKYADSKEKPNGSVTGQPGRLPSQNIDLTRAYKALGGQ